MGMMAGQRAPWVLLTTFALGLGIGIFAVPLLAPSPQAAPAPKPASAPATVAAVFVPPLAAEAPRDGYGDAVRLGEALVRETRRNAPAHVGNALACANCHLDAGRKPGAAPLWAAFPNFPAWRAKNGQINSFQKRVQDCFLYSMNGNPPALGSRELLAIEAYAAYMAAGLPLGQSPAGRSFPKIAAPALAPEDGRGSAVYTARCSACHGADGEGQIVDGAQAFPPLWGQGSYNWGAGMATIDKAAAFIKANMPQGEEGSLSVQEAWDVAWFIDGKVRPQDPRFAGSPAATRARHHDQPFSRYATRVGGVLLGDPSSTPPAGRQSAD